ncbi:enoyl-CoA hydratase [Shewanella sp. NFH-SH190041]|uniref:enoyl-CoA hydratase/isomerase family protein n=1 Tax=Shewanella sp. NFH-SH190041 TaxID=2950245 RepID=UPI0021C440EA|nr:enoyl-CoA hydratase/isomerase family protein [Shewanella sp. NFH-SH190041]BDM65129.1 enoyl-CoA hydratase [Shewanella sp. NFH-SH190041]
MDKVVFQTLGCEGGKQIGIATLNVEQALNALNLDMVRLLTLQLDAWRTQDEIACVVLDGAGDKAFCAGGDVRAITQASRDKPGQIAPEAQTFFTEEYQLDYLIHTLGKPVLVWGDGIVMGGGLGLMAAASHRVVTQRSRIAMPEVTIGLYPDVGGSFFLNRMPGKTGLFLGLTGYNMNGADALYVDLANFAIDRENKEPLWDALAAVCWQDDANRNHDLLSQALNGFYDGKIANDSRLKTHQGRIDELMAGSLADIHARLSSLDETCLAEHEASWLGRARETFLTGSPLSWHLIYAQMQLGTEMSLAECFRQELGWSVNCCAHGDFCEGVRALLLDKDKQPQWQVASGQRVPQSLLDRLMTSPWDEASHPLKAL